MRAYWMDNGLDAGSLLIATSEQAGTCGRADAARGMKVGEPHAVGCQPVDLRRLEIAIPKATDPRVTHVIYHDDDEVGFGLSGVCWNHRGLVDTADEEAQVFKHDGFLKVISERDGIICAEHSWRPKVFGWKPMIRSEL